MNIYRAEMLHPIAEAYQAMGQTAPALNVYARAVEAGSRIQMPGHVPKTWQPPAVPWPCTPPSRARNCCAGFARYTTVSVIPGKERCLSVPERTDKTGGPSLRASTREILN